MFRLFYFIFFSPCVLCSFFLSFAIHVQCALAFVYIIAYQISIHLFQVIFVAVPAACFTLAPVCICVRRYLCVFFSHPLPHRKEPLMVFLFIVIVHFYLFWSNNHIVFCCCRSSSKKMEKNGVVGGLSVLAKWCSSALFENNFQVVWSFLCIWGASDNARRASPCIFRLISTTNLSLSLGSSLEEKNEDRKKLNARRFTILKEPKGKKRRGI